VVPLTTLYPSSVANAVPGPVNNTPKTGSYTIFDPTAAYLQAEIYGIEYAIPLATIAASEATFTQTFLPTIEGSEVSQTPTTYTDSQWNFIFRHVSNNSSSLSYQSYYQIRDENFMNTYNKYSPFLNNPIAFIQSGPNISIKNIINCGRNIISSVCPTTASTQTPPSYYNIILPYLTDLKYNTGFTPVDDMGPSTNPPLNLNIYGLLLYLIINETWRTTFVALDFTQGPTTSHGVIDVITVDAVTVIGPSMCRDFIATFGNQCADVSAIPEAPNVSIPSTILTNPLNWNLRSFMTTQSTQVQQIIDGFNAKKSSEAGILFQTVPVVGTYTSANLQEIQDSIRYSMYFNFTDESTVERQILVSAIAPCNLYMSPDCSGMNEFIPAVDVSQGYRLPDSDVGQEVINFIALNHNSGYFSTASLTVGLPPNSLYPTAPSTSTIGHCNTPISDDILRILPYHTRDYIRRWAIAKTGRIISWYNSICLTSIETYFEFMWTNIAAGGYLTPWGVSYTLMCSKPSTAQSGVPINLPTTPRSYNEPYNPTADGSTTHSVAPMFDLASAVNDNAVIDSVITPAMIPVLQNDTTYTGSSPAFAYKTTITLPTGLSWLTNALAANTSGITLTISSVSSTSPNPGSFTGVARTYTSTTGVLTMNMIYLQNIFINGVQQSRASHALTASSSPPVLPNAQYIVSYTDTSDLAPAATLNTSALTAIAVQLSPVVGKTTTLSIPTPPVGTPIFATGNTVIVYNNSNPAVYFSGTITSYTNTTTKIQSTLITNIVVQVSQIVGQFVGPAIYLISLDTTGSTRHYLTTNEKQLILNSIAQCYYDLSGGNAIMYEILDVFQVGHTIFDVRFQEVGLDTNMVDSIQQSMSTAAVEHIHYRGYNMSADEFYNMESEYLTLMNFYNTQLASAITGTATNCGLQAQSIILKRTDTAVPTTTGICLSQVVVIDNTGNNVAGNALVTANPIVYPYEAPSALQISTAMSASNLNNLNTAYAQTVKYNREYSLIDGETEPRVEPFYYQSATSSLSEFVKLDLGYMVDITAIMLIFPLDYNEVPTYSISFLDSQEQSIVLPSTLSNQLTYRNPFGTTITLNTGTTTITKTPLTTTNLNSYYATLNLLQTPASHNPNMDPTIPTCPAPPTNPATMVNPYKVARFYATIDSTKYVAGNPSKSMQAITFTGYSLGPQAALTFNPYYNAGFKVQTGSGQGNTNYFPVISFKQNSASISANAASQAILTTNCNDTQTLTNIMQDYITIQSNGEFQNNPAIVGLGANGYDFSKLYYPTEITSSILINQGTCGISWTENEIDPTTNIITKSSIQRVGRFPYLTNYQDWGATDVFLDLPNTIIYTSATAYQSDASYHNLPMTPLVAPIYMSTLRPIEAPGLNNLGGSCPPTYCEDVDLIHQLVEEYNTNMMNANQPQNQILRITKAVTVSENRCDFYGYLNNGSSTGQTITLYTVPTINTISNELSINTSSCSYGLDPLNPPDLTGGGQFIQENTPLLLQVYNYITEFMAPYTDSLLGTTGVYSTLYQLQSTTTIRKDIQNYRQDTYGAYGQIMELSNCPTKCSDAGVISEFVQAYNQQNSGTITSVIAAGTASANECDYVVSVGQISTITHGTGGTLRTTYGNGGTTEGYRVYMYQPIATDCSGFLVSTTMNVNGYQNGFKSNPSLLTLSQIQTMTTVIPTALNQPPWMTPITIGTQTIGQSINPLVGGSVVLTLTIDSKFIGSKVQVVDMNLVNNTFSGTISASNGTTVTIGTITSVAGTFSQTTLYTVRAVPPSITYAIYNPIETIDFIDCASPYALQHIGTLASCTNVNSMVCLANGTYYKFTGTPGNSATTVSITSAISQTCKNDSSVSSPSYPGTPPTSVAGMGSPAGISATVKTIYPLIIANVPAKQITSDTWEFRINTSDGLPFGDTYKTVQLYVLNGALRIRSISSSQIASSQFAFFVQNPIASSITQCAIAARNYWNNFYQTATDTQNKSIVGTIYSYLYDRMTDSITFAAEACDYGIHGNTDIKLYGGPQNTPPNYRYFNVVFRQSYGSSSLGATTIKIHSMTEISNPLLSMTIFSLPYDATTNGGYTLEPLLSALRQYKTFRFLRFAVQATPLASTSSSASSQTRAAEITSINFFNPKIPNTLPTDISQLSNPIGFLRAQYSVQDISGQFYNSYQNPCPIPYTFSTMTYTGAFCVNLDTTETYANYDCSINPVCPPPYTRNTLSGLCTPPVNQSYPAFKPSAVCNTGYTFNPDVTGLSYGICNLITSALPPNRLALNSYTMNTDKITTPDGIVYNLPCGLGYNKTGLVCTASGLFGQVNSYNPNPSITTPRLKLNIGQYLYITLNENETIHYYNFVTGVGMSRPTSWTLDGSMDGTNWVNLDTHTSYPYSLETPPQDNHGQTNYSMMPTNFFPLLGGLPIRNVRSGLGASAALQTPFNFLYDPSTSSASPIVESFKNPNQLLNTPAPQKRHRPVAPIDTIYRPPLEQSAISIPQFREVASERRIQYLKMTILGTRAPSKHVYMSMLQFITPLGPLPTEFYKISNPMGIHPTSKTGPEGLNDPKGYWSSGNRQALLIKFGTLPATAVQGFQFSVPQGLSTDGVPSEWKIEASFDGKQWELYSKTTRPMSFNGVVSPVYKFISPI
jgi:hypothetical protein